MIAAFMGTFGGVVAVFCIITVLCVIGWVSDEWERRKERKNAIEHPTEGADGG